MVAPHGLNAIGYEKCNEIRKRWRSSITFDEFLKNKTLLQPSEINSRESSHIWEYFQSKFKYVNGLIHYHNFYKKTLKLIAKNAINDGVRIVEVRHISGKLYNDNWGIVNDDPLTLSSTIVWISTGKEFLTFREEFDLYKEVIQELKIYEPNFELRVIIVAKKS